MCHSAIQNPSTGDVLHFFRFKNIIAKRKIGEDQQQSIWFSFFFPNSSRPTSRWRVASICGRFSFDIWEDGTAIIRLGKNVIRKSKLIDELVGKKKKCFKQFQSHKGNFLMGSHLNFFFVTRTLNNNETPLEQHTLKRPKFTTAELN